MILTPADIGTRFMRDAIAEHDLHGSYPHRSLERLARPALGAQARPGAEIAEGEPWTP
jgi:hypothetical protein